MNQLAINDIKSLETIPDISLYLLIFIICISLFILIVLVYMFVKFFKRKKSDKYFYYNELKNMDFKDTKEAAYKITKYGKMIISQDREKKLYEELVHELEEYKYKKTVNKMDTKIMQKFEIFMDSIDV